MKKHFVTFLSPGTFLSEETEKPISDWIVEEAVSMSKSITERRNAKPYGFYFTTCERKDDELDSHVTAKSKGVYYLGGKVLNAEGVKREIPNCEILLSNMKNNNWDRVVVNDNSWRTIQPLRDGDVVLDMATV
jgi:hypothetical protein